MYASLLELLPKELKEKLDYAVAQGFGPYRLRTFMMTYYSKESPFINVSASTYQNYLRKVQGKPPKGKARYIKVSENQLLKEKITFLEKRVLELESKYEQKISL